MTALTPPRSRHDKPAIPSGFFINTPDQSVATNTAQAMFSHLLYPATAAIGHDLVHPPYRSLEEHLSAARTALKIQARPYTMLFEAGWLERLFTQLDRLMDVEEWDPDDAPVTQESFATFLRLLLLLRGKRPPGLAAGRNGTLLATWYVARTDHLTVECRLHDRVRFIVSRPREDETDIVSGTTALTELLVNLAPYAPGHWFDHAR